MYFYIFFIFTRIFKKIQTTLLKQRYQTDSNLSCEVDHLHVKSWKFVMNF